MNSRVMFRLRINSVKVGLWAPGSRISTGLKSYPNDYTAKVRHSHCGSRMLGEKNEKNWGILSSRVWRCNPLCTLDSAYSIAFPQSTLLNVNKKLKVKGATFPRRNF